jgi:hypothetical protein
MTINEDREPIQTIWPRGSILLGLSVLICFALAYSQAPLYTSNQNQYFLHGAAAAGVGTLENDWLANTVDPTPVFSTLIRITFLLGLPALFHLYYLILLGIYLYSIWGLLLETLRPRWTSLQRCLVLLSLFVAHSFALRFALARIFGQEWRFIIEGGFAGQRLLGTVFQPSTFGVLLLLGMLLYVRGKMIPGVISVVLAATIHPTYLLSAALIIAGFMLDALAEKRSLRQPFFIGMLALLLISPILFYTWTNFQPTSMRLTELASQILVEERIPNHILLEEWLDATVLLQGGLVIGAVAIYRQRKLARIMSVITAAILLLTLFQLETGNERLALLFPWRPSALLVPLASTLLIGTLADTFFRRCSKNLDESRRAITFVFWVSILTLAALGIGSYLYDLRGKRLDTARPMFEYIHTNHENGDRFFIPPKQQDFRMATGAPSFIDFKSIPYVDTEVIEWHDRLRVAQNFYRDRVDERNCDQIDKAISLGSINHVVLAPDQLGLRCPQFSELVFSDGSYQVYKLDNAAEAP